MHVAKALAGAGQNYRSFCVAGAVFGERVRRFDRVENRVFSTCRQTLLVEMVMIRVAGAAPQMPCAHFSWRAQYFVDLDKKVAETLVKRRFDIFNVHFSWCPQPFVKM